MSSTANNTSPNNGAGLWAKVRCDVPASLVVFLVALPLCMGIAMASGLPPATGIITGVVGGILVGMLAGSPLQVSGPAAGLIVVVADILNDFRGPGEGVESALEKFGLILFLAGLMQLVAGFARLAQWFRAVSPAVLHGMLAGIGGLILLGQLHVMTDGQSAPSGWDNLVMLPQTFYRTFLGTPEHVNNPHAAFLGIWTLGFILVWQGLFKKKTVIPGSLVAVLVVSALTYFLGWQVRFVQVPANIAETIRLPGIPTLETLSDGAIWVAAAVIAAIASCESLLCAAAVDQLHRGPRTNFDRELAAQGVGNMVCGFFGALPMTGVIVRSGANVEAGAKSRLSAILHGVWLLAFVALLPWLLNYIPVACLAGILVYTGFKLININVLRQLWHVGKSEALIYGATFTLILVEDLLTGVLVGMALSAGKLLYNFTHLKIRQEAGSTPSHILLHLEGTATFLRLPYLAASLEAIPSDTHLHIRLEKLAYIDHACLELLTNWAKQHEAQGGILSIDWESLQARFRGEVAVKGAVLKRAS